MTGTGLDLTAAACWDEAVQRHGPRRFLRAPRHYLSYAGFDRWARAVAARLAWLGVRAGRRLLADQLPRRAATSPPSTGRRYSGPEDDNPRGGFSTDGCENRP